MNARPPKILVVGSLVMDLITSTQRIPNAGETVIGCDFSTAPGGKGANQAFQAARLGADVTMVGKVGDDGFGQTLVSSLASAGVDVSHITRDANSYTAVGNIQLLVEGGHTRNNRIIVAPGANYRLTPDDVAFLKTSIADYDMVLTQLEIPQEINELVARWAKAENVPVILNPAPAAPLSPAFLADLTYIAPNEHEAAELTGIQFIDSEGHMDEEKLVQALTVLHQSGPSHVIITLGSRGSVLSSHGEWHAMPCVPGVDAIDPTAAGDSFLGAFCVALSAGLPRKEALTVATHTAAITVSRAGAQPSLPDLDTVLGAMARRGISSERLSKIRSHLRRK